MALWVFFALQIQTAKNTVEMKRRVLPACCGRAACKHLFQEAEAELARPVQFITSTLLLPECPRRYAAALYLRANGSESKNRAECKQ